MSYLNSELRQQRKKLTAKYLPKGEAAPPARRSLYEPPTAANQETDELTESNLMAYAILGSMTT